MQTEAEAFLQRIRAFPDDDAPRLIFADWLDEQDASLSQSAGRVPRSLGVEWGVDRSKFIRLQIALAHLNAEESWEGRVANRTNREIVWRTEKEERELLNAHREQWEAPIQALAHGLKFHRGFIEEANVVARMLLRHDHELFRATPLRHVHLLDVSDVLSTVFQCSYLGRLASLAIHGQHVGESLARAVAGSESLIGLRALDLSKNKLFDVGVERLAESPNLAGLRELNLADNGVGEEGAGAIAASSYLGSLRRLELQTNKIGPAGAEAIAGSLRLASLERLGVAHNEIGAVRLHSLSRMHDLLRVPILDLSSNGLDPAGLQIILNGPESTESGPVRLRELILSNNPLLGDVGMRVLAASPHLTHLRVLRLTGCGIGNEGARVLAQAARLDDLVVLDLQNNPIGDPGFRAFLDSPLRHQSLRELQISGLGISTDVRLKLNELFNSRS